jgi:hypothetical protein
MRWLDERRREAVELQPLRARAAAAARALAAGRIEWEEFEREFGDTDDPKIAELVQLIGHEPDVDGFFGVGQSAYRSYRAVVERLIAELEREFEG